MSTHSKTMLPIVLALQPPKCEYEYAMIATVLRSNIVLHTNAPHGYYIAPNSPDGNPILFKFVHGADAMRAYYETLHTPNHPTHNIPKLYREPSTFPNVNLPLLDHLPMRMDQQLYNSSHRINSPLEMQISSRMQGPSVTTRPNRVTPYTRESDINSLITLENIKIGDGMLPAARKVYYYIIASVDDTTGGTNGLPFHLPIDTGSDISWLFQRGYKCLLPVQNQSRISSQSAPIIIKGVNLVKSEWPEDFNKGPSKVPWPYDVYHPNMSSWATSYTHTSFGNTGYAEIQHGPIDSGVSVTISGWNWDQARESTQGFALTDAFDFVTAAGKRIITDNYDGNIGLAPKLDPDYDTNRNFLSALKAYRLVDNASVFIIRLVHPKVVKDLGNDRNVQSILSFGPYFPLAAPSNSEAEFSSAIPTSPRWIQKWKVQLLRIGITISGSNSSTWIEMTPNEIDASASSRSHEGNQMSVFPSHVVTKILADDNWLGSSVNQKSSLGTPIMNQTIFKKLHNQFMFLEFRGEDSNPVRITVPASLFLLWYPTLGAENRDPYYYCAITGSDSGKYYLGQNWYWAAIVKHVIPTTKNQVPYVQVMSNGYFYDKTGRWIKPEDMIMKSIPPRLSRQ
ncbi:hypothetical protein C8R42DRAFT_647335 [Lentinula raphanica]|nr:hypothetical protein C8R42DRAFT_647335 [Lentinula raphanica]